MPCLYCGKGLAFLQRLRGGGEFCSDAHRLKYQEEYNELALSRLIQSQPPEGIETKPLNVPLNKPGTNGAHTAAPESKASPVGPASSPPVPAAPITQVKSAPPAHATATLEPPHEVPPGKVSRPEAAEWDTALPQVEPLEAVAAQPAIEVPAPIARFVVDLPTLVQAKTPSMVHPELEFGVVVHPELPMREAGDQSVPPGELSAAAADIAPARAGAVGMGIAIRGADSIAPPRISGVELRESTRSAAASVLEFRLGEADLARPDGSGPEVVGPAGSGPDTSSPKRGGATWIGLDRVRPERPLDFSIPPVAPAAAGLAWLGNPGLGDPGVGGRDFGVPPTELGDLARLSFAVETLPEIDELGVDPGNAAADPAAEVPEPQQAPAAPMPIEPYRKDRAPAARADIEPVHIEPVQIDAEFLRSLAGLEMPAVEPPLPEVPLPLEAVRGETARGPAAGDNPPIETSPAPVEPRWVAPERVTRPLPLTLHGFPPGRAKTAQIYTAALRAIPETLIPATGALPLRPVMVFGPAPVPATPATAAPAPVRESSGANSSAPNSPAPNPPAPNPPGRNPAPPNPMAPAGEEKARAQTPAVTEAPAADPRSRQSKSQKAGERIVEAAKLRQAERSAAAEAPAEKSGKPAATPQAPPEAKAGKPAPAEPKTEAKLDVKPEPKPESKPEVKAEPKAAEPKTPEHQTEPKRDVKSAIQPDAAEAPRVLFPPLAAPAASMDLGLPSLQMQQEKSRMPAPAVLVAVAVVLLGLAGGVYKLSSKSGNSGSPPKAAAVSDVVETGAPLLMAEGGWIDDWAPQPPNPKVLRTLSILRNSIPLSDYRVEFEAQIESKAMGWVFRAANPKNYYVTKLEIVKPGIEPGIDVVHFAIIDGEEQPRVRAPLPVKVRVDTTYKIRFEALGDRFTTYVQGQKVDQWSDSRLGRGAVGLYRERGESALLKGGAVRVVLIAKKK